MLTKLQNIFHDIRTKYIHLKFVQMFVLNRTICTKYFLISISIFSTFFELIQNNTIRVLFEISIKQENVSFNTRRGTW